MKVKITYFKKTGKWYSDEEFISKLPEGSPLHHYWEELEEMFGRSKRPGLVDGENEFFVVVEVPEHEHAHPRMILPILMTKAEELSHGCLSKVADDEPIFVLRAQDRLAPVVVAIWALLANDAGIPLEKVKEAEKLLDKMRDWQEENGCKMPD